MGGDTENVEQVYSEPASIPFLKELYGAVLIICCL